MAGNIRGHIAGLLQTSKRHTRYVGILALLAVVVAFGVTMGLRRNGRAATVTETVLDCHAAAGVAHTHNADCYDADGNLVCPLQERELHVHDDSCYSTDTKLVCGQEEHTHSDACYDEEGNLVCGMQEHTHSDACYETTRTLTCGKEEVTEEHVHGPGCFKTVTTTVEDEEAEGTEYPAQEFAESLKQRDNKGVEHVVLAVSVKAPEGALPEGTEMTVSGIAAKDIAALEAKVEAAVKQANGDKAEVKQYQAVDIKFFDKDGKEIEPKKDVEVKITSPKVNEIDSPLLVHVLDKSKDNQKSKKVDAEVLGKVSVVNFDDADKSKGNEDTLKFKSDEFSPYVIVEVETLTTKVITAEGETYSIEATFEPEAGIPSNARLEVEEIATGSDEYLKYSEDALAAMGEEDSIISFARFFDVSIYSGQTKVEPAAPVDIKITYDSPLAVPEDGAVKQVHFAAGGIEVLDVEATKNSDGEVVEVEFSQDSFSVTGTVVTSTAEGWPSTGYFVTVVKPIGRNVYYAVSNTGTLTEVELTTEGSGADAVMKVKFKDLTTLDQLNTYNKWEHEAEDNNHRLVSVTSNTSGTRNFIDPADSNGIANSAQNITRNNDGTLSRNGYYLTVDESRLRLGRTYNNNDSQRAIVYFCNDFVLDGSDDPGTPVPEGDDPDLGAPATTKSLTANNGGDGTYKLALTVTGTSQGSHDRTEADVLVVFDTSGSMTSSRITAAKAALRELAEQLLGNNTSQYPNTVRMAMITFSTDVNRTITNMPWTNSVTTFAGTKTGQSWTGGYVGNTRNIPNEGTGGTNWEAALQEANKASNWTRADAEKYVIFISDGDPTFHKTNAGYNNWNNNYNQYGSGHDGFGSETNVRRCYDQAKDDAKALVDGGKNFYTIGVFGSLGRMSNITAYAYSGNDTGTYPEGHFQTASDQAALKAAFDSIIEDITKNFKFTDVTLTDGITDLTAQTGIVSGDVENFEYKITYTDARDNQQKTVPVTKNADGTVTIPSVTYGYIDNEGKLNTVTTEATTITGANYTKSAEDHGSVSWNLEKTAGTDKYYKLEAGWTYEVSFDVWPSQNAYDILAALNNGDLTFGDPNATWDGKKIDWTQFAGSEGNYSLLTNTSASVTYRQISTKNGEEQPPSEPKTSPIIQTPSMTLTSTQMKIQKVWNDSAFVNNRPESIELEVLSDGEHHHSVTLTGPKTADVWEATIDIAPGLKVDGQVKETGHDYTVVEIDGYRYNFETETIHPMLIDSATNITYGGDGDSYLTATNTLRGGINVTKKVVSPNGTDISATDAEKDKEYTFTLAKLELPDGVTLDGLDPSYNLNGKFVVWAQLIGTDGSNIGSSYQIGQGDTFKLKPGQTLRLTNMPVGTKYGFTEANVEGYELDSITVEKRTTPDPATPSTVGAASGTVEGNTNYYYVFNNKRTAFNVDILKVDSVDDKKKLEGAEFVLYEADGVTPAKDADGNNIGDARTIDGKTVYVVTSDADGAIELGALIDGTYVLQEITAPDGYNLMASNVTITVSADSVAAIQGTSQCEVQKSQDGMTYTISVENSAGTELPMTGGPGTALFNILGSAIATAAVLTYLLLSRRTSEGRSWV